MDKAALDLKFQLEQFPVYDCELASDISQFIYFLTKCPYNPFDRSHTEDNHGPENELNGHLGAIAWILNPARTHIAMMHHRQLDRWLPPGGHAEGMTNLCQVAQKEAFEEVGILPEQMALLDDDIFDVNVFRIPASTGKNEPEHWHYDITYIFEAPQVDLKIQQAEGHAAQWVALEDLANSADLAIQKRVKRTRLYMR